MSGPQALSELNRRVVNCRLCPRLVEHRERTAREKRAMYRDETYWGRPLPSFGDPQARLLIVGLAPAAHGGNRTGRMFTGDSSGNWLFETLHKFGFASSPTSRRRDDGLTLTDAYITASVRCAPPDNKPTTEEKATCRAYLAGEMSLLDGVRVVVALGRIAFDGYLTARRELGLETPRPTPRFGHGATYVLADGLTLVSSYHPSRQNTNTGTLTRQMFEDVFAGVRRMLDD
ncbi:MAG: uracil-DNA glycosylase [Chloroflexota bacterium]|nr:uracil-DNA glycosylase [Chloroflexota bacterium]MDE2941110.1 uracil-DNA glycosylase [Chloroflexota bacterium]MDE3267364.1 uracil-DNA glycosylase [Chloroflexota bacterium]